MRIVFETGDNDCDFEVFPNDGGTITFDSHFGIEKFIFTMTPDEVCNLIDHLKELVDYQEEE